MVMSKDRKRVLLLHASIHFLTMLLLVGAVRFQIWYVLLAVAVVHYFLDLGKIQIANRRMNSEFLAYLLDQALHVIVLGLASAWIAAVVPVQSAAMNDRWAIYLAGFLAVTYVWYTTEKVMAGPEPGYLEEVLESSLTRMITRACFLLLFLLAGARLVVGVPLLAVQMPYRADAYRRREILTDLSVSLVTAAIVLSAI
jgi:hypothetical protein